MCVCVCVCVMGGAALRCRAKTYGCTASPPTAWQSTRQPTGPDTCAAALPPGQQAPCTRSDAARESPGAPVACGSAWARATCED